MPTDLRISSVCDHDMKHYAFERRSGLSMDYYRRKPLITAERVLMVLVCAVIVWALLPWGHV